MTNHTTVERVARQLCEQRGLDFDATVARDVILALQEAA